MSPVIAYLCIAVLTGSDTGWVISCQPMRDMVQCVNSLDETAPDVATFCSPTIPQIGWNRKLASDARP